MKVFSGELAHETNTFCQISTDEECFRRSCYLEGQEVVGEARRGTRSGFGAVYEACEKFGWELSCNLAATANPSGALTSECFETMVSKLLKPLAEGGVQPDGVLLMLHGAMVSEQFEDSEGEIVKRCRAHVPSHRLLRDGMEGSRLIGALYEGRSAASNGDCEETDIEGAGWRQESKGAHAVPA